jgi:hypothetical protein
MPVPLCFLGCLAILLNLKVYAAKVNKIIDMEKQNTRYL